MRIHTIPIYGLAAVILVASSVSAQDTIPPAEPAEADSLERAIAEELGELEDDTSTAGPPSGDPSGGRAGAADLNPDISVIGETLADLSPDEPHFIGGESRFLLREVELGLQAVVDPYFRADFFLGVHPDATEIEEAYLTALSLPWSLQARVGRMKLPFGKVNLSHRPEQITVDYPLVIQDYFGAEGLASTGVGVSKIFAPFGFFQDLQLYVVSEIGAGEHAHEHGEEPGAEDPEPQLAEPERDALEELGFLAHLENYWDLTDEANIALGFSAAAGTEEHETVDAFGVPRLEVRDRQFYGADLTVRWRPLGRGLYRSFVWNTEVMTSRGADGSHWGGFTQAQWQLARRWYMGGRFDALEPQLDEEAIVDPVPGDDDRLFAGTGYLTFFPSEFSRFKLGVQKRFGDAVAAGDWRIVIQTTAAIGPHRPHAF